MLRRFGVEIEILGISKVDVKNILHKNGFKNWKFVSDHSICGCENPFICTGNCLTCEVISPILLSKDGFKDLEKICYLLERNNAKVNNTCGFHVHIDAKDLSLQQIESIYKRYAFYEKAIDLFHPKHRRGNNNNYCLSIRPIIEMMDEMNFTIKEIMEYSLNDKYYKLNILSLSKLGSIEFRQHKGTINFDEIRHWILFCQDFINASLIKTERDFLFRGVNNETKEYYTNIMKVA